MSDTQYKIQSSVFTIPEKITKEEAAEALRLAGVLDKNGNLKEEYEFMRKPGV